MMPFFRQAASRPRSLNKNAAAAFLLSERGLVAACLKDGIMGGGEGQD